MEHALILADQIPTLAAKELLGLAIGIQDDATFTIGQQQCIA